MSDTSMVFNLLGRDRVSLALAKVRASVTRTVASIDRVGQSDGFSSLNAGVDASVAGMAKLAKGASAVVAAMSGAQSAVGVAVALSGALGLIPAGAVAGGVAMATLKLGVSGFADAVKDSGDPKKFAADLATLAPAARDTAIEIKRLHPQLQRLKKDVQGRLFTGFAGQLKTITSRYLPTLDRNLSGVAGSFNSAARSTGRYLTRGEQVGMVSRLLAQARATAANLAPALRPAVSILLNLASAGGSFLPQLTSTLGSAANAAARFVANARQTGQLHDWISVGLSAVKQLGQLLSNIVGIVGQVVGAFSSAGAGVLPLLVRLTDQVKAFLASAQGQRTLNALAGVLSTVSQVVSGVLLTALQQAAPVIVALAPAFGQLAQQLGATLVSALTTAGPLLLSLATWLSQNIDWLGPLALYLAAGTKGFLVFAGAVRTVKNAASLIRDVTGAVNALGKGVGKIGAFVGKGVGALGRLGGKAAVAAGRVAASGASMAASAARASARVVVSLGRMAAAMVAQSARMVASAAVTAARVVAGWVLMGVQSLIQAARMAAAWLIAMGPIALVVAAVVAVVALIVTHWQQIWAVTKRVFSAVKNAISTAINAVIGFVKAHWPLLISILLGPLGVIIALVVTHFTQIKNFVSRVLSAVVGFVKARIHDVINFFGFLASLPGKVAAWFGRIKDGAIARLVAMINWVRGLPGRILHALGNLGSLLVNAGRNIVSGLWHGIERMAGWLIGKVKGWILSVIPGPIASALGIASPSKVAAALAQQVPRGVQVGIDRDTPRAVAAVRRMVGAVRKPMGDMVVAGQATGVGSAAAGPAAGRAGARGGAVVTFLGDVDGAFATAFMKLVRDGKIQVKIA